MNLQDNSVFGRKVFFISPSFHVEKNVIRKLIENEYEVYVIKSYKYAKAILRRYPDSICVINFDAELSPEQWFNFVLSFEEDPKLSTIFLGITSERAKKTDKDKFLLYTTIPAGFIQHTMDMDDLTATIISILSINGAKGRRKFVRADTSKMANAIGYFSNSGKTYSVKIQNISSVGISCFVPLSGASLFPISGMIRNFSLTLDEITFQCNVAVLSVQQSNNKLQVILMFLKGMPYSVKAQIHSFVYKTLQETIALSAISDNPDTTDYSTVRNTAEKLGSKATLSIDETNEVEELEEVEYVEEVATTDNVVYADYALSKSNVTYPANVLPKDNVVHADDVKTTNNVVYADDVVNNEDIVSEGNLEEQEEMANEAISRKIPKDFSSNDLEVTSLF